MQGSWTRAIVDEAAYFVKDEITEMMRLKPQKEVLEYCLGKVQSETELQQAKDDALRVY